MTYGHAMSQILDDGPRAPREASSRRERSLFEARELYDMTREICSQLELDEVLQAIVRRANRILDNGVTYLATCDDAHRVMQMRAFDNVRSPRFRALSLPYGVGLGGAVAAARKPMMVNDYQFDTDDRVRHSQEIEEAVIEEGLRCGAAAPVEFEGRLLAVLFVAHRVPYRFTEHQLTLLSSLANAAAIAINNAQVHGRLVATTTIHKNLMEIALADRGPAAVAHTLVELVHGPVALLDWQGRPLANASYQGHPLTLPAVEVLADWGSHPDRDGNIRVIAIQLGGETEGYLVAELGNAEEDLGVAAVEQAGTVFALELAKLRSAEQSELRLRGGLLNELLSYPHTDELELVRHAERLGCDLRAKHVVTIIRFRNGDVVTAAAGNYRLQRLAQSISRVCSGMSGGSLVAERGAAVVALTPANDVASAQCVIEHLVEQCRAAGLPDVVAGVGSVTLRLSDYSQSFAEAARAADAASRLRRLGSVIRFDQLDFHQLVLGARPTADIIIMARRVLAPLSEYDARRGGALVHTVRVFLECNGNAEAAARKLNLHPNSLRGRLIRITDLLGRDLAEATTRLDLLLALESCALLPDASPVGVHSGPR